MKILLVQPKSSGYMGQISKSGKAGFARVTLTTIAALTPPEHEVVIHDARLSEPDYDGQWDLVGFTGMTCEIPHVYRMAAEFRKRGITVVIGGYHATALPDEAVQQADMVVVGEAEGLWQQILSEIRNGGAKQKIYKNSEFAACLIEICTPSLPRFRPPVAVLLIASIAQCLGFSAATTVAAQSKKWWLKSGTIPTNDGCFLMTTWWLKATMQGSCSAP
jgi:hypothetical protein